MTDRSYETLPGIGFVTEENAGMCYHSNALWLVFPNKKVMCLDIQLRKWKIHKPTLKEYYYAGCLITQDNLFLYIFSNNGVERRPTNDYFLPWETVNTLITGYFIKFFPNPYVNN